MKRFLFAALSSLFLFLSLAFPAPPKNALAEGEAYACILGENTYLYETERDSRGLFILPQSYYVKLLETGETYAYVEYLADGAYTKPVRGYCKRTKLTPVDYLPQNPYLYKSFTVTYTLPNDPFEGDEDFLSSVTLTCGYYGDYKIGSKTYCYVLQNGKFGYLPKPSDLTWSKNTEYEDRLTPDEPPSTPTVSTNTEKENGVSPAQIAVLVLLVLLVPVVATLVLKSGRNKPYEDPEE